MSEVTQCPRPVQPERPPRGIDRIRSLPDTSNPPNMGAPPRPERRPSLPAKRTCSRTQSTEDWVPPYLGKTSKSESQLDVPTAGSAASGGIQSGDSHSESDSVFDLYEVTCGHRNDLEENPQSMRKRNEPSVCSNDPFDDNDYEHPPENQRDSDDEGDHDYQKPCPVHHCSCEKHQRKLKKDKEDWSLEQGARLYQEIRHNSLPGSMRDYLQLQSCGINCHQDHNHICGMCTNKNVSSHLDTVSENGTASGPCTGSDMRKSQNLPPPAACRIPTIHEHGYVNDPVVQNTAALLYVNTPSVQTKVKRAMSCPQPPTLPPRCPIRKQ